MPRSIIILLRSLTVLAWVVAAVDVCPWGPELDPDASLFTVAFACVGSYAMIARANSRPAVETFLAGKEVGRREAMLEQECVNVTRLSEPTLRVVQGGR